MFDLHLSVKNKNTTFLPILLGTDANCYGMARSFHQAYGIKSLALGKYPLLETKHSKIVHVETKPDFDQDQCFVNTLHELANTYLAYYDKLILIACGDRYTELLSQYKETLSKNFYIPYIPNTLKLQLENKEAFYKICEAYQLDYPSTYFVTKASKDNIVLPFDFPVAIKASNSITYVDLSFEGKKKAYKAETREEMQAIVDLIYANGYDDTLIIQDFIPGDASAMYVLNAYVNQAKKVQMMCLGHVILEDHTPHGIGNYNGIIQEGNQALYDQYQNFLEAIGYVGFANFDLKYDERDGKFKVFEINIRQGRSSFFTTASGCNLVTYLIDDLIHGKDLPKPHYHDNPYLWLHVPQRLALECANPRLLPQIRRLINEKKVCNTLLYDKDMNLYRYIRINRFYQKSFEKYRRYAK